MRLEQARDLPPSRAAFQPLGARGAWTNSLKDSFTSLYSSAAHSPQALVDEAGLLLVQRLPRAGESRGNPSPSSSFSQLSFQWNVPFCCTSGAAPTLSK